MIKIDKSVFSAEELAQYEALIAKASVDPSAAEGEMEKEKPAIDPKKKTNDQAKAEVVEDTKKSDATPEMKAALERLETLTKSLEMKEFTEIAKKYAPLGENEEDLAGILYEMKKSSEENYNAYVAVLDKSLGLVEKSGVFSEIGKSFSGSTGSVIDKVNAAADEIQKADSSITREGAIAKAWTDNPEFIKEYEDQL